MTTRFLQIHTLTSYPAALLNRDDAGFAKRISFGGAVRTRVSSQCLKRHWRTNEGPHSLENLDVPMSVRSRLTFDQCIARPLTEEGLDSALVEAATILVRDLVLGKSKKKKKEEDTSALQTGQLTVLGWPEVRFLKEKVRALCTEVGEEKDPKAQLKRLKDIAKNCFDREAKKNLAGLKNAAGLDASLFGRMATSDLLARGDAAVHVAHSLTVHKEETESDYFSAVDDLQASVGQLGSGHINATELTSGLYYGYVVVDVSLLVSNLTGVPQKDWRGADRELAASVVERLIHLIATVSPGAKLGATAPYSVASLLLVEAGDSQPRTLANAFLKPVSPNQNLLKQTYSALQEYLTDVDSMYELKLNRRLAAIGPHQLLTSKVSGLTTSPLSTVSSWAANQIREA